MAPPSLPIPPPEDTTAVSSTAPTTPSTSAKAMDSSLLSVSAGSDDGGAIGPNIGASKGWSSKSKMMVVPVSGSMKAGSGFDPIKWKAINPGPISSNYTRKTMPNAKTLNIRIIQDVGDLCEAAVHLDFDPVGPCAALLPPKLLHILNTRSHVVALLHIKSSESQFTMLDLHGAELSHGAARRSSDVDPTRKVSKLKEDFGSHVVVATETGWALTRLLVLNCQNPHMRKYVANRLLSQCGRWHIDEKGSGALRASLSDLGRMLGHENIRIMDFVLAGGDAGYTLVDVPYSSGGSNGNNDGCYRVLVDVATHAQTLSVSASASHTSPQPFRAFIVPLEAFTTNGQPLGSTDTDEVYDKRMWEEYLKEYTRLLFARAEAQTLPVNPELRQQLLAVCDECCRDFSFLPGHVTCVSSPTIWKMQDAINKLYTHLNEADKGYLDWVRSPSMAALEHDPVFQNAPASLQRAAYQGSYLRDPTSEVNTQMGVAEIRDIGAVHHGIMVRSLPVLFGEVFADERHLYVTVVIAGIDAHHNASTRVKVYAEDISSRGFMITAETFEDSSVNSVLVSWVATTSPSIFMGQVKTDDPVLQWSAPNFHGPSLWPLPYRGPSVRRVDVPVTFPRRLEKPPAVWAGVHQLNLDRGRMRVRTRAVDVTNTGFTLAVETKDDTCLWEIGVSWLATLDPDVTVAKEVSLGNIEEPITSDHTFEARLPVPPLKRPAVELGQDAPAGSADVVVSAVTTLTGIHALCDGKNARIWTSTEMDRDNAWVVKGATTLDGVVVQANIGTLFHTRPPVAPSKSFANVKPSSSVYHALIKPINSSRSQQQAEERFFGVGYEGSEEKPSISRTSSWSLFRSRTPRSSSCMSTAAVDTSAREPPKPAVGLSSSIPTSDYSSTRPKSQPTAPSTNEGAAGIFRPIEAVPASASTTSTRASAPPTAATALPASASTTATTTATRASVPPTAATGAGGDLGVKSSSSSRPPSTAAAIPASTTAPKKETDGRIRESKDVPTGGSKPALQGAEAPKSTTTTTPQPSASKASK